MKYKTHILRKKKNNTRRMTVSYNSRRDDRKFYLKCMYEFA